MVDIGVCWWVELATLGIAAFLSSIYLFLLRCIAKPLLYVSFILIFILAVGGGFYVFEYSSHYTSTDTVDAMKGMGILLWILAGLYLIILMCCCSRIQLAVAIMEAASDFVSATWSVFLVPFTFFFIIAAWMVFWIVSAVYVYSCGTPVRSTEYALANIEWNETTRYVWIYHIFGFFWITAFIIGCA